MPKATTPGFPAPITDPRTNKPGVPDDVPRLSGAARGTCGPILARLTPQALWAPIGVSFTPDLATIERICSSSRPARDEETFVA